MAFDPDFLRWAAERGIDLTPPGESPTGFVTSDMGLGMPSAAHEMADYFPETGDGMDGEAYAYEPVMPPALTFRDRLGAALAAYRPTEGRPYESGLSAGLRGLSSGLAGGFAASASLRRADAEKRASVADAAARLKAEREWTRASRSALERQKGESRSALERQKAGAKAADKAANAKPVETEAARLSRIEAEAAARARGAAAGRPVGAPAAERAPRDTSGIRWTDGGKSLIRDAERVLTGARADARRLGRADVESEPAVVAAQSGLMRARRTDIIGQMREAKTLREARALAAKTESYFPDIYDSKEFTDAIAAAAARFKH